MGKEKSEKNEEKWRKNAKDREKWRKIGTFLGKKEKKREKMRRILTAESAESAERKMVRISGNQGIRLWVSGEQDTRGLENQLISELANW